MTKSVFLDTNIYLHYQMIDQLNWVKIIGPGTINILVPPITIRELNKHKETHPKSRVRNRATKVIKWFFSILQNDNARTIREGITVIFEDREPLINFEENQLSHLVQDDQLIASILNHREENPEQEIILITSDEGLNLLAKSRRLNISTLLLADEYKLPTEPDPEQLKINELENEVRKLRQKTPKLSLLFENGDQHKHITLPPQINPDLIEIIRIIEEIKLQYPKLPVKPIDHGNRNIQTVGTLSKLFVDVATTAAFASEVMNNPTEEDIELFNAELEKFYKAYDHYLHQKVRNQNLVARSIILGFQVANLGTAPGEDIDVILKFPGTVRLFVDDSYLNAPKPPKAPIKPRSQLEKMQTVSETILDGFRTFENPRADLLNTAWSNSNVSEFQIHRMDEGYEVSFYVDKIKHHNFELSDSLYLLFNAYEDATSFQLPYEIICADLPDKISGSLHVVIEKN